MERTDTSDRERIASEVRAELARRKITGRRLAADLGWPVANLSRRLAGNTSFTAEELAAVARYLGLPLSSLVGQDAA